MQFLFGMGEAGAFPNMSRAVYNWFPASQRGFAQGSIWLAARFLGGFTPFIWVLLVDDGWAVLAASPLAFCRPRRRLVRHLLLLVPQSSQRASRGQ